MSIFWEAANYNKFLSKEKSKSRVKVGEKLLELEKLIRMLNFLEINMTKRTIQRYIKDKLIPIPERHYSGKGDSRRVIIDYGEETPAELYASFILKNVNKANSELTAKAREFALIAEKDGMGGISLTIVPKNSNQLIPEHKLLAIRWLALKHEASRKINEEKNQQ